MLKFIETDFGLPPLTARDMEAADMTQDFDFNRAPIALPAMQEHVTSPNADAGCGVY